MVYLGQGDLEGARQVIREARERSRPPRSLRTLATTTISTGCCAGPAGAAAPAHPQRLRRPRRLGHRAGADLSCPGRPGAVAASTPTPRAWRSRSGCAGLRTTRRATCILGLALAYLGRKAEAVAAGEKGVALLPIAADAYTGPYMQHQLVRIYLWSASRTRRSTGSSRCSRFRTTSRRLARIDPNFDPRGSIRSGTPGHGAVGGSTAA